MAEINPADYITVKDKDSGLYLAKYRSLFGLTRKDQLYKLAETNAHRPTIRQVADLIMLVESDKPR